MRELIGGRRVILCTILAALSWNNAFAQQFNGVFTSPWYNPTGTLSSAYDSDHVPPGHSAGEHLGVTNVALWQKEVLDMQRAGLDFFAPYSFGHGWSFWADPAVYGPTMGQAVVSSGTTVRMAHFHDTQGEVPRQYLADGGRIDPNTGLPLDPVLPFDLARGEAHVKKHVYDDNIRQFFNSVPVAAQFRPLGFPVLFFHQSYPHWTNRELLGDLLIKIRQWFVADFGVQPFIILEKDWRVSRPDSPLSAAAIAKINQNANAFFSWDFPGTPGVDGVVTPGGYPGGGRVEVHNGLSVGTAGVGYAFGSRLRDRRNGLTLVNDWQKIRNATLRMIAAWYDYDEDSGISRTAQFDYQYIDLVKQLTAPAQPVLSTVGPAGGLPAAPPAPMTLVVKGNRFLPGAVLLFSADGVNISELPMVFVSAVELHQVYAGAPAGSYFVAVRNPDGTQSPHMVITVQP